MKTFLQFISESTAVQQATRMGLKSDGHGGWYDNKGEFVAKTEKGQLKFFNKRQRAGEQDPPQTDQEKKYSQPVGKETKVTLEPPQIEKTKGVLTVAFGRFNPPTTGHEKLLDSVASSSDEDDYIIVPSRSNDPKKNPLDAKTKVAAMKQMFPKHSKKIVDDESNRTIFDVLKKAHVDGYAGVRIVGGSDRVAEFEKLANNYNKKLYDFDSIEVSSAGDRDPDSDDVTGMSASKQRKAAAEGDLKSFMKGIPSSMSQKDAEQLFKKIRTAMNIKEGWSLWEIAPKFDWKGLRENYISEKIFTMGQFVENLNSGLVGKIIRRGTNYLICVTEDNLMFKSWIKDVSEAVVNGTHKQGVPPDERLIGTDKHLKYVQSMVPGSSYGKQFINKYRKK